MVAIAPSWAAPAPGRARASPPPPAAGRAREPDLEPKSASDHNGAAAPPIDPDRVWLDDLVARLETGREAYREGRWAEAAEWALSVHEDIGGANNLYYAAVCYQHLGDRARAAEIYADYLDESATEGRPARPMPEP